MAGGIGYEPKSRPARMQPKYGGEPLPLAPICLPQHLGPDGLKRMADKYVQVLDAELTVHEEGQRKWSGSQRQYLRQQRAKWRMRALGEDAHYLKHGTFIRPMASEPPGESDLWQEQIRRREEERTGIKVSSAAHRRKWMPGKGKHVNAIVKKWQKQYGTKDVDLPED